MGAVPPSLESRFSSLNQEDHTLGYPRPMRDQIKSKSLWEKSTILFVALLVVALLVLAVGIATGLFHVGKSAFGVAEASYMAASRGEYDTAMGYLTSEARERISQTGDSEWREAVEQLTQGRTLREVKPLRTQYQGEKEKRARVGIMLYFEDGTIDVRVDELIRDRGRWKMVWPSPPKE